MSPPECRAARGLAPCTGPGPSTRRSACASPTGRRVRIPPMDYSQEQVTKALLALAANAGDAKLTAEQLQAGHFKITEATLLLWRHEHHRERYERFARELAYERESRV